MTLIDPKWIETHKDNVTREQIENQGLVVKVDGRELPPVYQIRTMGAVTKFIKAEGSREKW